MPELFSIFLSGLADLRNPPAGQGRRLTLTSTWRRVGLDELRLIWVGAQRSD